MTKSLDITKHQATTLANVALEQGCEVEVEKDGVIYRIRPLKNGEKSEKGVPKKLNWGS